MALQDVCGFHDLKHPRWNSSGSLLRAMELHPTTLDLTDDLNLGSLSSRSSDRYGGTPLHFIIPSPPISVPPSSPSTSPPGPVRRPFSLCHGTTTLGLVFQGGVIAAADTRASAGGLVACPAVHKLTPIHSHLVAASSGSGADCMLWERILTREIRLYQLRHGRRLSIGGSAKLLSHMLHPFKGTDVCVAVTLCGWEEEVAQVMDSAGSDRMDPEVPGSGCLATMPLEKTAESERQGVIQDALAQDVIQDALAQGVIQDALAQDVIQDGLAQDVIQDALAQGVIQDALAQGVIQDALAQGVIQDALAQDVIQDALAQGVCDEVGQMGTNIELSRNPVHGPYGPKLVYVCSDGARLQGELFSVGSGSPYAYGVLDGGFRWSLSEAEAFSLAREAVFRATHRDAYSGNSVDVFHITAQGWRRREREDLKEEYYREKEGLRRRDRERIDERKM